MQCGSNSKIYTLYFEYTKNKNSTIYNCYLKKGTTHCTYQRLNETESFYSFAVRHSSQLQERLLNRAHWYWSKLSLEWFISSQSECWKALHHSPFCWFIWFPMCISSALMCGTQQKQLYYKNVPKKLYTSLLMYWKQNTKLRLYFLLILNVHLLLPSNMWTTLIFTAMSKTNNFSDKAICTLCICLERKYKSIFPVFWTQVKYLHNALSNFTCFTAASCKSRRTNTRVWRNTGPSTPATNFTESWKNKQQWVRKKFLSTKPQKDFESEL